MRLPIKCPRDRWRGPGAWHRRDQLRCSAQAIARSGRPRQRQSPAPARIRAAHHAMSEGLAREGFDVDLRHGLARENALVHLLLRAHVEVKSDGRCAETGRLFIEYRHNGRPSGIAVTTADRWAFEFDEDCWLIVPTNRLRAIARLAYRRGRIARGGDHNRSEGVLVPITWLTCAPNRGAAGDARPRPRGRSAASEHRGVPRTALKRVRLVLA